jgi:aromatic amino acid aminotransferase I
LKVTNRVQLWLQVDWYKHPDAKTKSILNIEEEIFMAAIDQGVLISRGSWFTADKTSFVPTDMFFRATFAAASEEKMTEAIERFGVAVRDSFGLE